MLFIHSNSCALVSLNIGTHIASFVSQKHR